jgi:hypothetical protein
MRRLVVAALFVSAVGLTVSARAACDGPGVAAGDHGEATVTFTAGGQTVNIHTSSFGNFVVGPAQACADGSVGLAPTTGFVTIKIDGETVCTNTNKHPLFDPFIFGGGVHNDPVDPCGADVTWDGLTWMLAPSVPTYLPDPIPIGPDATGVHAGDVQPAAVDGIYWFEGTTYTVPAGTVGWFSNHGAQAAVYL